MELIILLIFIGPLIFLIFRGAYDTKEDKRIEQLAKDIKKIQKLIDSSNAEIWKWAMDGGSAYKRAYKRKQYLEKEGVRETKYLGGGYLYIVPATLKHNQTNAGFSLDPKYTNFLKWKFDRYEPGNYAELVEKFEQMRKRFPYYRDYDERPYKIGYTTRNLEIRMKELNETDDLNYQHWQFEYGVPSHVWIEKDLEHIESRIHWALRDLGKEVMGEIFCATWNDISAIVKEKTGQEITLSDSRQFTKAKWPDGDQFPQD